MGLDELHLRVLATSSEDLTQKRNAQKGLDETISFSLIISIDFLKQYHMIEAYAEGKTLGPSGTSLALFSYIYFRIFFKGSSTGQCRKYVYFGFLKPEFMIFL